MEQLKEAVRRDRLDFLIPLTDPEVDALAPRKAEFRALGCTVCVPEEPVAALCRRIVHPVRNIICNFIKFNPSL